MLSHVCANPALPYTIASCSSCSGALMCRCSALLVNGLFMAYCDASTSHVNLVCAVSGLNEQTTPRRPLVKRTRTRPKLKLSSQQATARRKTNQKCQAATRDVCCGWDSNGRCRGLWGCTWLTNPNPAAVACRLLMACLMSPSAVNVSASRPEGSHTTPSCTAVQRARSEVDGSGVQTSCWRDSCQAYQHCVLFIYSVHAVASGESSDDKRHKSYVLPPFVCSVLPDRP